MIYNILAFQNLKSGLLKGETMKTAFMLVLGFVFGLTIYRGVYYLLTGGGPFSIALSFGLAAMLLPYVIYAATVRL